METVYDTRTESHSDLLAATLALPMDVRCYELERKLTALFPDKAVVAGDGDPFDLKQFAEDGHCEIAPRPDIHSHFSLSFTGIHEEAKEEAVNVWFTVRWQGNALQVVLLSWRTSVMDVCPKQFCWIVAETESSAKEFYQQVCEWAAEVRGEVLVFDGGSWSKDRTLFKAIQDATFANLILPPGLKQEIQDDFAQFFASRSVYERYRIPWKRGVLLIGPPGNGKTHTVKALINQLSVPCLYVKSFKSRYGTDQGNIRSVFRRARQTVPCILVMEDIDSLIDDRNRSFFLNELDGFASNTGIVVLATTNHPERLDPALVNRPSRFDRKYYFELPAPAERIAYIRAWNETVEPDLRISEAAITEMVGATEGFSFAYLKELFLSSLMRWISHPERRTMEAVIAEQCGVLREQMQSMEATGQVLIAGGEEEDEE